MRALEKSLKIMVHGRCLSLSRDVYSPAEDSFLLASHVLRRARGKVLDVGTGSGVQAVLAASKADKVVAVDINEKALRLAKKNAKANRVLRKCDFRHGNLFSTVKKGEKFDVIVCNPPYLPTGENDNVSGPIDSAWNGGADGRKVIDPFLEDFDAHLAHGGELLLLHCHLADTSKTIKILHKKGFSVSILEDYAVPGEILTVLLAHRAHGK